MPFLSRQRWEERTILRLFEHVDQDAKADRCAGSVCIIRILTELHPSNMLLSLRKAAHTLGLTRYSGPFEIKADGLPL